MSDSRGRHRKPRPPVPRRRAVLVTACLVLTLAVLAALGDLMFSRPPAGPAGGGRAAAGPVAAGPRLAGARAAIAVAPAAAPAQTAARPSPAAAPSPAAPSPAAPSPAAPSPARSSRVRKPARSRQPAPARKPAPAPAPVYRNPLREVSGLVPWRVDMGVDFDGTGPVFALGDAVITRATASDAGWPGGGWISYRLTAGPAAGLVVYVAEDVVPQVQAGQQVSAGTVIGRMFRGGAGIETGWATPDSTTAESELAVAGGIFGWGPFPTRLGVSFDELLIALGAPAAPNLGEAASGLLPGGYPATWAELG